MNSVTTTAPFARNSETPAMSAYLRLLLLDLPEHVAAREVLAAYAGQPALQPVASDRNLGTRPAAFTRAA